MTDTRKSNPKEGKPTPTIKKVLHREVEESITLKAEQPQIRYLKLNTIYRPGFQTPKIVPELRLCGNWLEQAGFEPSEYVTVTVMNGLLIIRNAALEK